MTTYRTGLQFDNKTVMSIVSGSITYNSNNFQTPPTALDGFFSATPVMKDLGNNWVELTGPMNIASGKWADNIVEIWERWGYDPIKISLTFSDGHVIHFDDIQRDAYLYIDPPQGVAITQGQGTNKIDNMTLFKWTRHDVPRYDRGLLIFTIYQDNVPVSTERWMARLSGSLPLCDVNLPGSHDSAAIFPIKTLWRAQQSSITEQLQAGVRALDVRLKVIKTLSGTYEFYTCHGNVNLGWIGVYQSLVSLLDECASFLKLNNTEAIVMSLKIDDWNGFDNDSPAVLGKLSTVLSGYPVLNGSNQQGMPTLREAREHIYLFNRIDQHPSFGVPLDITGNQQGFSPSTAGFTIYVQDYFQYIYPPTSLSDAEADKQARVKNTFALSTAGVKWNFVSAVWGASVWQPLAVDINAPLLSWLGSTPAVNRPAKLGWCFFDLVTTSMATISSSPDVPKQLTWPEMIISSNFSYQNQGAETFSIP